METIKFDRKQMTKKQWKIYQAEKRSTNGFNTGERPFDGEKYKSRAKRKKDFQKILDNELNK